MRYFFVIPAWLALTPPSLAAGPAPVATPLTVDITPAADNPAAPRMGDHLTFHSTIRNTGTSPVGGVVAWLSIVQTDPGQEQPIGLEDWSAQQAVAEATLAPGATIETDWPMRLIQAGHFRAAISATTRDGGTLVASPLVGFAVGTKPVVESGRVLPVALGVPFLLGGLLAVRLRRRRG